MPLDRPPLLEMTWNDPVTGRHGYVVIDHLVRGVAGGGLRMREGLNLREVRDLARAMTLKEAVAEPTGGAYQPVGGAKGGVDCAPDDPEARGILERFVDGVRPILEQYWATGEDLGVSQELLDEVFSTVGMRSSVQAILRHVDDPDAALDRVAAGFAVDVEGISLGEVAGGFGVAEATVTAVEHLGLSVEGARAVVQGFGTMGAAAARYLARHGIRVVGVADAHGTVANADGLDVEALLAGRDVAGLVPRDRLGGGDRLLPRDAWKRLDADILVPAAVSYTLDLEDVAAISAGLIVEAANCPTTPQAEAALVERGVTVLPDFVANSAANSWWWWTLFGDVEPTASAALGHVASTMGSMVDDVLQRARLGGVTAREAAKARARAHLEQMGCLDPSIRP